MKNPFVGLVIWAVGVAIIYCALSLLPKSATSVVGFVAGMVWMGALIYFGWFEKWGLR